MVSGHDHNFDYLPKKVIDWAGNPNLTMLCEGKEFDLSEINDDLGKSFEEIADLIEEQWERRLIK